MRRIFENATQKMRATVLFAAVVAAVAAEIVVPMAWPRDVVYIGSAITREELSRDDIALFAREEVPLLRSSLQLERVPLDHPAYDGGAGMGLFATRDIPVNTTLGEYAGVMMSFNDTGPCTYCGFHDETNMNIDAQWYGNEFRFINACRGITWDNNVVFTAGHWRGDVRITVMRTKYAIAAGEEILLVSVVMVVMMMME